MRRLGKEGQGVALGLLAVALFSLNLPLTRLATRELDPLFIGLGRCLLASVLAAWVLALDGGERPQGRQWAQFGLCSAALIVGCLFYPYAMAHAPAAHGAVIAGIQPLLTALAACWRNGERPSPAFWACALLGSLAVAVFAYGRAGEAGGSLVADVAMLGAVGFCAVGYAEGGRLALRFGGWRTICWAMALAGPFLLLPTAWVAWDRGVSASVGAWAGLLYISVIGLLLGTYPWYAGMARGGVARVGQVQLLQPFLTLAAAGILFGEAVPAQFWLFALLLTVIVAVGRRLPVRRPALQGENA